MCTPALPRLRRSVVWGLNTLMTALGGRYVDLGQVRDRFQPCSLVTYRPLQVPVTVRRWNHA